MGITEIAALQKWSCIPKEIQQKLIDNVYCGECVGVTTIVDYDIVTVGDDIALEGKCEYCGHKVARLIEFE